MNQSEPQRFVNPGAAPVTKSRQSSFKAGTGAMLLGGLLVTALIATQATRAWLDWRAQEHSVLTAGFAMGDPVSVMLVGGQIYYGSFAGSDARHLQLKGVYYVQSFVDPATNNQGNRLVSRNKADWHSPELTVIALDKTVMVERVGKQSRLALLIEQDKKTAPAP